VIARAIGRLGIALTRLAHRLGHHGYMATGCLHGNTVLPDGRTGHQYCQDSTGKNGAKKAQSCKFCAAPCRCRCHREPANGGG
jgi:hypothetical protein